MCRNFNLCLVYGRATDREVDLNFDRGNLEGLHVAVFGGKHFDVPNRENLAKGQQSEAISIEAKLSRKGFGVIAWRPALFED